MDHEIKKEKKTPAKLIATSKRRSTDNPGKGTL
jgi:hypothetical protein